MSLHDPLNVMTALISVGMLLLGVGYNRRESNFGIGMLAIGILVMMSSLLYRLYLAFGS